HSLPGWGMLPPAVRIAGISACNVRGRGPVNVTRYHAPRRNWQVPPARRLTTAQPMPKTVSAPPPASAPVQEALALCCRHAVERARGEGRPVLAAWSVEIDARSARDPLAMGARLAQPGAFRFYWEHPRSAFALAAGGVAMEVQGSGAERFSEVS